MRVLSRSDVAAAGGGDIAAAMADIRHCLALLRAGDAEMPAETSVRLGPPEGRQARAYALPARVGDRAGVKWTAHRPPGSAPAVMSLTAVNEAATGMPIGVVESALLTATRTAATSASVLLARPPRRVALLGAGVQAAAHLRMLAALFPGLQSVALWNRTPARAAGLVAASHAPWPITSVARLEVALDGADTVITCTNADTPLLGPTAMLPGRSILQVGYNEVSFDAIDRADAVVVDLWGEFRLTSAKSLFQMHRAGRFAAGRVAADLAAVVLDGWRPAEAAAVYFSSFGLNLFDIALAARVLRVAEARGIGTVHDLLG
jgi:ornithine cyclodeaminase